MLKTTLTFPARVQNRKNNPTSIISKNSILIAKKFTLSLLLCCFISSVTAQARDEAVIISNNATDAAAGTFDNLTEGAGVIFEDLEDTTSDVEGDGNDMLLVANLEDAFITKWKTDNPGTSDANTITIPTISGLTYNYTIDWGDGDIENITTDESPSHTYATPGEVTVTITGDFPRISFNNGGDRLKLLEIQQWGAIAWSSMQGALFGCRNLIISATDAPNLSNVTSMESMLRDAGSDIDINLWSDIGHWNVSNVQVMSRMFQGNSQFNQDISSWNVGNVEFMFRMFNRAANFNQDISSWNVSKVRSMAFMFELATSFDRDLGTWDISSIQQTQNVITGMNQMFANVGTEDGTGMSTENYDNTLIGWATLDPDAGETQIPTNIIFNGGNSQYCLSEFERFQLTETYGWTFTDGGKAPDCVNPASFVTQWKTDNQGLSDANTITIPTISGSTYNYNYIVDWGDGTVEGFTDDTSPSHTYETPGEVTVRIMGDFPSIQFNFGGDRLKLLEVQQWGTIAWETMDDAFSGCENLEVTATDIPDLSNLTDMNSMFLSCKLLLGIDGLDQWNVFHGHQYGLYARQYGVQTSLWTTGTCPRSRICGVYFLVPRTSIRIWGVGTSQALRI